MDKELEKQLNILIALLRNAQLYAEDTSDEEMIGSFITECRSFRATVAKTRIDSINAATAKERARDIEHAERIMRARDGA